MSSHLLFDYATAIVSPCTLCQAIWIINVEGSPSAICKVNLRSRLNVIVIWNNNNNLNYRLFGFHFLQVSRQPEFQNSLFAFEKWFSKKHVLLTSIELKAYLLYILEHCFSEVKNKSMINSLKHTYSLLGNFIKTFIKTK